MFRRLTALLSPFHHIAYELQLLRELYELDLNSRNPPVFRITQKPSKKDTEVSYMGDEEKYRGPLQRLREGFEDAVDED